MCSTEEVKEVSELLKQICEENNYCSERIREIPGWKIYATMAIEIMESKINSVQSYGKLVNDIKYLQYFLDGELEVCYKSLIEKLKIKLGKLEREYIITTTLINLGY